MVRIFETNASQFAQDNSIIKMESFKLDGSHDYNKVTVSHLARFTAKMDVIQCYCLSR